MFKGIDNKIIKALLNFIFTFIGSYVFMWVVFSIVISIMHKELTLCPLFMSAPAALAFIGSLFATIEDYRKW